MRHHLWKKIMACFLVVVMMVTMFPSTIAEGADQVTVNIESFIRGVDTGLRSSELLVAKVEGYDGHASELTYKWTNDLGTSEKTWFWTTYYGTYLYVYDSHNMYTVQGTASEQEIYNSDRNVNMSDNMTSENSHDKTFAGVGYMYAAVYGADLNTKDYTTGSITVEVYDGDTLLCSDTYSGFEEPSLQTDLDNATFGVFIGETVEVKDLLGESAILHVNCTACSVTTATITSGSENITINGSAPNYTVTGLQKGIAEISITVKKENCKFHQYESATSGPKVYVFKKPNVTPGLTTLTLTNLDEDCTYYINHVQGVRSEDNQTVVFEGLTPATTYEIEVKGKYPDGDNGDKFAYAFVNGTTLTPRTVGVMTLLDLSVVKSEAVGIESLYLQEVDSSGNMIGEKIPLTYNYHETSGNHNYTAQVADGLYWVYDGDGNRLGRSMELVVNGSDTSGTLSYFSVNYDVNGGNELENTENPSAYFVGSMVHATSEIPTREGYYFTGWKHNGTIYQAGSLVSAGISEAMTLTAQWEDAVDIYVNFTINHISEDGSGYNNDNGKHDVTFTVDGKATGSVGDYTEMVRKTIEWDEGSEFDVSGYDLTHDTSTENKDVTIYKANAPTFKDMPDDMEYTVTTAKSGYVVKSITSSTNENGDVVLDVELVYDPNEFDLVFEVELDSDAKALPAEMKPVAANVKVLMWHDSPYVEGEGVDWYTISQHYDTYVQVDIDSSTGKGTGTYPVWMTTTDTLTPYSYRIEVVSFLMPDGSVIAAANKEYQHIEYVSADERYVAKIEVTDGQDPDSSDDNSLTGVWYEDGEQQGQVKAVISIKKPTLTLIANGGTIGDTSATSVKIEEIITVPSLTEYEPTYAGYIFAGWYDANDNKIAEGMSMTTDVTAYARWIETITINGNVTVQNYYYNNEIKTLINDIDRVKDTTVILRRRVIGTTNFVTVAEKIVTFADTSQEESTASFEFSDLPKTTDGQVDYEYIVVVRQTNYDKKYNPEFTYEAYNVSGATEQRTAAKPEIVNNTGSADVLLSYAPEEFLVPYKVDVTQIVDAACRPTDVKVVYEYAIANSDFLVWNTITQHDATQGHSPLTSTFNEDGYASSKEGEYPVWSQTPDGKYEYFYRLKVVSYTLNGTEITVGSTEDKLFNIYYGSPITVSSTDPTITATFSPLPLELTLDTGATEVSLNTSGYTDMGTSETTGGEKYNKQFVYGTGVESFPTPVKEGYSFLGWFTDLNEETQVTSVPASTKEDVYLIAKWEEGYTINFLSNNPDAEKVVFRTYYQQKITLPEGDRFFHLSENDTIPEAFYDIPTLDYEENNKYIFKGWYLDQDSDERPLDWDTVFEEETNIYAHWIEVGTVAQDENDTKESDNNGVYSEYDLIGTQIREGETDGEEHYGIEGSGLRFITVLSEKVYKEINSLHAKNPTEAEYGFVLANAEKAQTYAENSGDETNYQLHYNDENVNGVNTNTAYSYAKNLKCSGVKDHFNCDDYRLYTGVVTYKNKTGEALLQAQATKLLTRSYIRYWDANGLYRTHYNNYTGTPTYHGLSTSYSQVYEILNGTN